MEALHASRLQFENDSRGLPASLPCCAQSRPPFSENLLFKLKNSCRTANVA